MSKIICEVCGTTYPDTTVQCPICGCVRPGNAHSVTANKQDENDGGYTHVKGGRFSKSNVRKRNKINGTEVCDDNDSNRGLVITAIVLLLAIVAVVCYIVVRFFMPVNDKPQATTPNVITTTQATVETEPPTVPCATLKLETDVITLDKKGAAWMIYARTEPADTTDSITFSSSDETVTTVSEKGKVVAVGPGEAVITVTCGNQTAQCTVECTFELPTEETTEPEETTLPDVEFVLNREDITFNAKGDAWMLYSGSLSPTQIAWSTDDAKVATIENGKVTAVGGGVTTVYGEYNGEKVGCIIRCNFAAAPDTGVSGSGDIYEDGGGDSGENTNNAAGGNYYLKNLIGSNASDVTLNIGNGFTLALMDENDNQVSGVTWSVSNTSVCTVSGGYVVAVATGTVTVTATYNGQTYTCIVRVS